MKPEDVPLVGEVEANGQLEVHLDGGALVGALEGVLDGDVYLRSVERSVSGVQDPRMSASVQTPLQLL